MGVLLSDRKYHVNRQRLFLVSITPTAKTFLKRWCKIQAERAWMAEWRKETKGRATYRDTLVPTKKILQLHEGLSKRESALLVQLRSEKIFLFPTFGFLWLRVHEVCGFSTDLHTPLDLKTFPSKGKCGTFLTPAASVEREGRLSLIFSYAATCSRTSGTGFLEPSLEEMTSGLSWAKHS